MWLLLIVLLVLDALFLYVMSNRFSNLILNIQRSPMNVNFGYALLVYVFIVIQLYYFILLKNGTLLEAFMLGLTTYGLYEFTSASVFDKWNYKLAIIDTLWGGILYALTIYIVRYIRSLNKSIKTIV